MSEKQFPPLIHKFTKEPNRVTSFSIKPTDKASLEELRKLTDHSNKTGISFSFLIIQAIKKFNEELGLNTNVKSEDAFK